MTSYNIGITKIKEIEFFVDESINIDSKELISLNFEISLNINIDLKQIDFILGVKYYYENDNCFLKIKTSNIYAISNLDQFEVDRENKPKLPNSLLVSILSLSISHTRALLAKNSLGTKFSEYYIPIVNPSEMAVDLFKIEI